MYDSSGGGKNLRLFNSINMAWWHTYKHAVNKIWRAYANEVWAPLWHHLYPADNFFLKPSNLSAMVAHLLYVHMSYDSIRDDLNALLASTTLNAQSRHMRDDLEFLCCTAIPVVTS